MSRSLLPPESMPPFLRSSSHALRLESLYELYAELDSAIATWRLASGLACPSACGACCARYEPSVSPVEGMAVAAFAAFPTHDLAGTLEADLASDPACCVFYAADRPLHCGIYAARPLECRLFGFSATHDKSGKPLLRLCPHMAGPATRSMGTEELLALAGTLPPVMSDYGARLEALAPSPPLRLREQARAAWRTLQYIGSLAPPT